MFSLQHLLTTSYQQQQEQSSASPPPNNSTTTNSTCPEFVSSIAFQKNDWARCPDTIVMPIVSAGCLFLYAILIIVCIAGLIKKRRSGHITSRTISGLSVTISGSFIYVAVTLLRFVIGRPLFPCIIFSIVSYTIAPCFAMPSILRCLRLVFQHRMNLIKTNSFLSKSSSGGSIPPPTPSQQQCNTDNNLFVQTKTPVSPTTTTTSSSITATATNNRNMITSGTLVETFESQRSTHIPLGTKEKFVMKVHSILTNNSSSLIVFWVAIAIHFFLWFIVMTVEDSFFRDDHFFMNGSLMVSLDRGCGLGVPSTGFVVITSVFYFIIEFIVIGFCFTCDNDTWSIKTEIFILVVTQVISAALFTFFSVAPMVEIVDYFIPSGIVVVAYSTFEVVLTILIPILRAIYKDAKEVREGESEIEMIIANKETNRILLDFLRKSFCPENLLCFTDIENYKHETTLKRRKKLAHQMVQNYLDTSSPLQLNLPSEMYAVKERIMDTISFSDDVSGLPDDLFYEVQIHVLGNLLDAYTRLKFSNKTIQKVSNDWNAMRQKRLSARSPMTSSPSLSIIV